MNIGSTAFGMEQGFITLEQINDPKKPLLHTERSAKAMGGAIFKAMQAQLAKQIASDKFQIQDSVIMQKSMQTFEKEHPIQADQNTEAKEERLEKTSPRTTNATKPSQSNSPQPLPSQQNFNDELEKNPIFSKKALLNMKEQKEQNSDQGINSEGNSEKEQQVQANQNPQAKEEHPEKTSPRTANATKPLQSSSPQTLPPHQDFNDELKKNRIFNRKKPQLNTTQQTKQNSDQGINSESDSEEEEQAQADQNPSKKLPKPHQSVAKVMPLSFKLYISGAGIIVATAFGYFCYRITKYVQAKIKQKKDLATRSVSVNVVPDVMTLA